MLISIFFEGINYSFIVLKKILFYILLGYYYIFKKDDVFIKNKVRRYKILLFLVDFLF